jgi:hypothetical protein
MTTLQDNMKTVKHTVKNLCASIIRTEKYEGQLGREVRALMTGVNDDNTQDALDGIMDINLALKKQVEKAGLTTADRAFNSPWTTCVNNVQYPNGKMKDGKKVQQEWVLSLKENGSLTRFIPAEVEEEEVKEEVEENNQVSKTENEIPVSLAEFVTSNLETLLNNSIVHGEGLNLTENDSKVVTAELLLNFTTKLFTELNLDVIHNVLSDNSHEVIFRPLTDKLEAERAKKESDKMDAKIAEKEKTAKAKRDQKNLAAKAKRAAEKKISDAKKECAKPKLTKQQAEKAEKALQEKFDAKGRKNQNDMQAMSKLCSK